jgi:hypothetical protein
VAIKSVHIGMIRMGMAYLSRVRGLTLLLVDH